MKREGEYQSKKSCECGERRRKNRGDERDHNQRDREPFCFSSRDSKLLRGSSDDCIEETVG